MLLKRIAGALALVALALPVIAQQSPTARDPAQQSAPSHVSLKPKYLVAFGHVLARTDQYGVTKFKYENGRLASEVLPDGTVGTYQYESGKFTGIVYTDGRYSTLSYDANGTLSGLTSNTGARVKFNVTSKLTRLQSFKTIQNGISALRNAGVNNYCISDDPNGCAVIIVAESGGDNWGGGADVGGTGNPAGFGEGGGEGAIHNPPGEDPAQCVLTVCKPAHSTMTQYCMIAANTVGTMRACMDKANEYYGKCSDSCATNDWSWLNWWLFAW